MFLRCPSPWLVVVVPLLFFPSVVTPASFQLKFPVPTRSKLFGVIRQQSRTVVPPSLTSNPHRWCRASATVVSPTERTCFVAPCYAAGESLLTDTEAGKGIADEVQMNQNDDTGDWSSSLGSNGTSLASSYVIYTNTIRDSVDDDNLEERWSLLPIGIASGRDGQSGEVDVVMGEGTAAITALGSSLPEDNMSNSVNVVCRTTASDAWKRDGIVRVSVSVEYGRDTVNVVNGTDEGLIAVLSRVMVQRIAERLMASEAETTQETLSTLSDIVVCVSLPGEEDLNLTMSQLLANGEETNKDDRLLLFRPLLPSDAEKVELVDMVNSNGQTLGIVPRTLVHSFNLLHRGVGVLVSKGRHIRPQQQEQQLDSGNGHGSSATPEVYVHRRTDFKRIFPSLYDMFVGGVSGAGERPELTAAREIAEELGLKRALQQPSSSSSSPNDNDASSPLSEELFKTTICTSYNRCVVSVFTYKFDPELENIKWQAEEVAWGEFVPYDIVEIAGRLSINRLKEGGKWPGTGRQEEEDDLDGGSGKKGSRDLVDREQEEWRRWDFVPDGLLVWEAWVRWMESGYIEHESSQSL